MQPLADRMRPKTLDEMYGQQHLLAPSAPLRQIIQSGRIPNMIFYGPPGIGKTTLASIIAGMSQMRLHRLNGTSASTGDIKAIVEELDTLLAPNGVLLYLDEIQYFNKKQQQTLLEYMENGKITLIASTTENPYFYVYGAILSRCTVFEFKPLRVEDLLQVVDRALACMDRELQSSFQADAAVREQIAAASMGDVRRTINTVEALCLAAKGRGTVQLTIEDVVAVTGKNAFRFDRDGDSHYDILSAFQKSMRGSDPDAAIHYLARLVEGGDLPSICRRLLVTTSEDVGLAYPQAIAVVNACVSAALQVGLPEARIPLAEAVLLVATSPKSNSAILAIEAALEDIRQGRAGEVPEHLKDSHYEGAKSLGHGTSYQYAHNGPNHYVPQQYLPDTLRDRTYYQYGDNKTESATRTYWEKIKGTK